MMNKSIFLMLLLLLIPYCVADKFDYLQFDHNEIGFSRACTYYYLHNPDVLTISESKLNSLQLSSQREIHGSLSNPAWEWETVTPYQVTTPVYTEKVEEYECFNNLTQQKETCKRTVSVFSHNETVDKERIEYKEFGKQEFSSKNIEIKHKEKQKIRLCADITREFVEGRGWTVEVDHIPVYDSMVYDSYIWWNDSYFYRWHIDNNASLATPYPYVINDTHGLSGNYIHALIANNSNVYSFTFELNGMIAIANNTNEKPWFNSSDCLGYSVTNVYKDAKIIWCCDNNATTSNETLDCSGNSNTGMCRNMVGDSGYSECDWDIGRFGGGIEFDGVNDYILGSDTGITGNDSRTVLVWANGYAFKPGVAYCNYFELGTANVNQKWTLGAYNNWHVDGYGGGNQFDTGVVATTGWHHHAVRYEGNIVEYFLDGVSLGTWSHQWNTGTGTFSGSRGGANGFWNGTIDEVYVFNRSLSTEEIIEYYQNGLGNRTKLGVGESILPPAISGEAINDTEIYVNGSVKLNCSVIDDVAVDMVKFYIIPFGNLSASHTGLEYYIICNATNPCNTTQIGQYNWSSIWVNDTSNNINSTLISLNYSVTISSAQSINFWVFDVSNSPIPNVSFTVYNASTNASLWTNLSDVSGYALYSSNVSEELFIYLDFPAYSAVLSNVSGDPVVYINDWVTGRVRLSNSLGAFLEDQDCSVVVYDSDSVVVHDYDSRCRAGSSFVDRHGDWVSIGNCLLTDSGGWYYFKGRVDESMGFEYDQVYDLVFTCNGQTANFSFNTSFEKTPLDMRKTEDFIRNYGGLFVVYVVFGFLCFLILIIICLILFSIK